MFSGSASGATVSSGGTVELHGGAIVGGVSIKSGGTLDIAGGYTLDAKTKIGGVSGGLILAGVTLGVLSGGRSISTHVRSGALLDVKGGQTSAAVILKGGVERVSSGGSASGTTVLSGGLLTLSKGGQSGRRLVSAGGAESVLSGGTASGTKIAGGRLTVSSGGHVGGTETIRRQRRGAVGRRDDRERIVDHRLRQGDALDLASFGFKKTETLKFVEAASHKSGTLTVTDGALKATVTLFGQYVAGGFKLAADGAGTAVTYVSATAAHTDVLAKEG